MLNNHSRALPLAKDRSGFIKKIADFMKKKSVKMTKLSISKTTVASLNPEEQNKVAGGVAVVSGAPGVCETWKSCIIE